MTLRSELGQAMRRVGAKILQCREQGNIGGVWEGAQFKAAADKVADECMRTELRKIADILIVSEEDASSQVWDRPTQYWLIDPIDGTASFAGGFDGFVCQAAFMSSGRPGISSVYAPALERLYLAERGKGATVNGAPVAVKSADRQRMVIVDNYPQPKGVAESLVREFHGAKYLESGSIGLKICLVAEGAADIFVKDVPVRDWDVAAPHLVLQEAGGVLTQLNGKAFDYQDGYEKHGLIVTSSDRLLDGVREFLSGEARHPLRT